ncbi:MAG: FISUMP domain-containing protein, partial [Bacteroidales bacterium]
MERVIIFLLSFVILCAFKPQGSSSSFTDSRDGRTYKTVTIGNQVWMAENLAYLPAFNKFSMQEDDEKCYYVQNYYGRDLEDAIETFEYKMLGALYNWPAAIDACPEGWHLPNDDEWTELIDSLGGDMVAGGPMKGTSTTYWLNPNEGATNTSGFNGFGGGYRGGQGFFNDYRKTAFFWSSSEYDDEEAWYRMLTYLFPHVTRNLAN